MLLIFVCLKSITKKKVMNYKLNKQLILAFVACAGLSGFFSCKRMSLKPLNWYVIIVHSNVISFSIFLISGHLK